MKTKELCSLFAQALLGYKQQCRASLFAQALLGYKQQCRASLFAQERSDWLANSSAVRSSDRVVNKELGIKKYKNRGYVTMLVLVFAGVFFTIVSALSGFVFLQNKVQIAKENREKAFQIAEAGLDYYKWFLAHFPNDLKDGTGTSGPYVHSYSDPEGGVVGNFSLDITGNTQCGIVTSINITSTGVSDNDTTLERELFAKYSRPSVAEYSFILNTNDWKKDQTILGKYHSNNGVRMDADNKSLVSSSVASWTCTSSRGCDPDSTEDGIFGIGDSALWQFPVPQIDFNGITADLSSMKNLAQNSGGIYLGDSGAEGYHIYLQSDGTFDVYRVDTVGDGYWAYSSQWTWEIENNKVLSETFLQTYTPPADCSLVFVEDMLWLEGTVKGKLTIVSADLVNSNIETDIYLVNNIEYSTLVGTDGLTVIAEEDILLSPVVPDDMSIRGIFIAQTGHFGRNYYHPDNGYSVSESYQNSFTINGSIISNGRSSTRWDCPDYCSGFNTRNNSYDQTQANNPPPLTPYTSDDFRFVQWREETL